MGLIQRTVCPVSGLLATDDCVSYQSHGKLFSIVTDWFDYLSVPTEYCDMHVSLPICELSGLRAGDSCDPATVKRQVLVLLHPGNQFYNLSDKALYKIFGDTYRKTAKTASAFLDEMPICAITEAYAKLVLKRDVLIKAVSDYLAESSVISDAHRKELTDKLGVLQNAISYSDMSSALDTLQKAFDEIQAMYDGG